MEFRKMRRFKQQLGEAELVNIVKNAKTAVLGVNGDGGYPYTVPINFVYADNKIFFHCAKEGHKIDAIRKDARVSLCVVDKDDVVAEKLTTYFRSAIIFGTARILETADEITRAATLLGLKYSDDREAVEKEIQGDIQRLCCVEISIEHMTGKQAKELVGNTL